MTPERDETFSLLHHVQTLYGSHPVSHSKATAAYFLLTYLLTYIFTYLLTPWSRVILEKLTGSQPVMKFPIFNATQKFITTLTSARHPSVP